MKAKPLPGLLANALLSMAGVVLGTGFVAAAETPSINQERAYLGVQLLVGPSCAVEVAGNPNPICVGQVRPGSAAERAGLQPGDVFLKINQSPLTDMNALQSITQAFRAGQLVEIEIQRGGQTQTFRVQLEESDRARSPPAAPGSSAPTIVVAPFAQADACEATRLTGASKSSMPALPFHKLPPEVSGGALSGLLGDKQAAVQLQGDVLTLVVRSNEGLVRVVGSIQCAMDRVAGTDLWELRLQMPDWDKAFMSAQFLAFRGPPGAVPGVSPMPLPTVTFRGKDSPAAPPGATPLRGSITQVTVQSKILGMPRDVSVYLPPGTRPKPLPVLHLADGQEIAPFAAIAESLMTAGRTAPFAIIGEHSARYAGDPTKPFDQQLDARAREYLPFVDPPQFEKHLRFFVEELLPWAESQYGLSTERGARAAMGYSNGGAFAEALGLRHPELFSIVLPFSPATIPPQEDTEVADPKQSARFLFAAGLLEPQFLRSARTDAQWLKSKGVATETRWYLSGHDTLQWQQALSDYLPQVFPIVRSKN